MPMVDGHREIHLTHGQCANERVTSEWQNHTMTFLAFAIKIKITT